MGIPSASTVMDVPSPISKSVMFDRASPELGFFSPEVAVPSRLPIVIVSKIPRINLQYHETLGVRLELC